MFTTPTDDYNYSNTIFTAPTGENICCPVEMDTEYTHPQFNINRPLGKLCKNLTAQCRSIYQSEGRIYAHQDNYKQARHKVFLHGFAALDYLEDMGYEVELTRLSGWSARTDTPWIQFDIYAYFAVAELLRIFLGEYRDDVLSLVTHPTTYGIEQGRRLRTFTKHGNKLFNWVEMPWELKINGMKHRVRLCIYDTCAVHGIANYASFCANSHVILLHKDNFTDLEKQIMDVMYTNRANDFDPYALGDLFNFDALLGNKENLLKIYTTLGLEKYFTCPRLTIGATVSRMLEASIKNLFNAEFNNKNDVINKFCKYGSTDWLKRITTTTACLNAKVDGGRCRNNRPIETVTDSVICDIDISGCYGDGLRVQTYPLGIPFIIDYPIDSKLNDYQTLGQFLKKYKKELYPSLWQARVSCKDGYLLKNAQDYLVSWFPPQDMSNMRTDEDFVGTDEWWTVDNVGETKILNNEIHHAIVTHDFVQWLDNVASQKQKRELLDNLIVETAMFYPASKRVNSPEELIQKHLQHRGKNTCNGEITTKEAAKISIHRECHYWYGINLGELLVNRLLLERKKHPKKTSFNDLYKLCINTIYGDMVSPFFKVGNVIVGNNITARARALAWYMEKGLHGFQTITDGCAFDVNKVLFPSANRRITGESVVNIHNDKKLSHHTFAPLKVEKYLSVTDNYARVELRDIDGTPAVNVVGDVITELSPNDSHSWINQAAWEHLQELFPNLDILHKPTEDVNGNPRIGQFEFEAKGYYDCLITHGTANYILGYRGEWTTKMRSYSKREQSTIVIEDELLIEEEGIVLAEKFLLSLKNPNRVERGKVYLKEKILKCGDYRRNFRKWEGTDVYPGLSIKSAGLLREFSLSQFTFQSHKQLLSWRREYERLLRHYDQSYEMFFLNEDGTLNYQLMIETINEMITSGKHNFFHELNRSKADAYRELFSKHPESETLKRTRYQLDIHYLGECFNQ